MPNRFDVPYAHWHSRRYQLVGVIIALIVISLACGLPASEESAPPEKAVPLDTAAPPAPVEDTPTPTLIPPLPPTPTPQSLPPALVEADPPLGADFPLQGPLVLYFNQPMDRLSVEGALSGQPALAGHFDWHDDTTLAFEPDAPFPQDTELVVNLGTSARAANGQALVSPISLVYRTTSQLRVVEMLPEADIDDIDPASAIIASFNQPVVPLGADSQGLPTAFTVEPAVQGDGEWINTSTYIFYPDPVLAGGTTYTARLNPDLRSAAGGVLEFATQWSFSTLLPRLVSVKPNEGVRSVPLDTSITLTFNQVMDAASVEADFALFDGDAQSVSGSFGWDQEHTTMVYTPTGTLFRDMDYTILLLGTAQARGNTPLGEDFSARFHTVPNLRVVGTEPAAGGSTRINSGVEVFFSSPLESDDPMEYIHFTPEVTNLRHWWDGEQRALRVNGNFSPMTGYTLTVSSALSDPWGDVLGEDFKLAFRTDPLEPDLFITSGGNALFITPQETDLPVQAANLSRVNMTIGSVPFSDFVSFMVPGGYEVLNKYQAADQRSWTQLVNVPGDRNYDLILSITPEGETLPPGLYHLAITVPEMFYNPGPYMVVSNNVHLTFKLSASQAFVWAVDLRTNAPVPDAPITIYDSYGNPLATGQTDKEGVYQTSIPTLEDLYNTVYAVLGAPGGDNFALSLSSWSEGIGPYDFGLRADFSGAGLETYIYTDRPVYRPGQSVYFRTVLRYAQNGRYSLPDQSSLILTLVDNTNTPLTELDLPLSEFGTAHGEYQLPTNAQPGNYQLRSKYGRLYFKVAEYRKPEINLQVDLTPDPALADQALTGQVNARYFFDAPAGNIPLEWSLSERPAYFNIPGYRVGLADTRWLQPSWMTYDSALGKFLASGVGQTDADGLLTVEIPPISEPGAQYLTLEVTMQDESDYPVSARSEITVHPSDFYIGVRPDSGVGQAGTEISFDVIVLDWEKEAAGVRELLAEFQKVDWVREDRDESFGFPTLVPKYTLVSSAEFVTAADGVARLAFTPPEPGTYRLDVSGGGARTEVLLWVGGVGQVVWPNLPNQRLQITADREAYLPGETAKIFIPNPFGKGARALVTMERGEVLHHQVLTPDATGYSLELELSADEAPNVYIAVTLLGEDGEGYPDFRQGYLNIPVDPSEQTLNVTLTTQPERTGPREEVTFGVRVTDASGNPVRGEFSLAVVDLAALVLADPMAPDIVPAYYGEQPLGVRTSMALAVYVRRRINVAGGMGGGGDEASLFIREDFPDTAYWNAEIVTDENGEAQVSLTLPDSLTTWQVDVRGLTADTRVGQAEAQVVTTKDLLVRPVTPRFLVVGDHLGLAAIVHNNTDTDLDADVSLQTAGFKLDDVNNELQNVSVAAGGRLRVEWWGTVEDVDAVDLVFSAQGGGLQDAARPVWGELPVLHYTAPQTFGTAGTLVEGEDRLELVSLPRSYDPTGGDLRVELAPSLAAAMTAALEALEYYPYECTEQTLSRFLPNLELHRALQELGLESSESQTRLDRTLHEGLDRLLTAQNEDGGWSWWASASRVDESSDPYISAYVLFGLARARGAGVFVDETAIQRVVNYLLAVMPSPKMISAPWQLDRLAFEYFALTQAGAGVPSGVEALYIEHDQMSPWAKALLALTIESSSPGDERVRTLLSDLEATALRTSTGAYWDDGGSGRTNMSTPVFTSAAVVYAIAQRDPASAILPESMRYLMAHRRADGSWASTYETAWALLALTEVMRGTGELAGDFGFSATLNGTQLADGQAGGDARLNPVTASVPVSSLYPEDPNALIIQRDHGPGRLYYTAHLNVVRPVEDVAPLDQGISVGRSYTLQPEPMGENQSSKANLVQSAPAGDLVTVRLVLTLKNDVYYLMVEDFIPAGAEILDTNLKTSQQGVVNYDTRNPFRDGWGWWYFHVPQIFDDHISWAADYLPAGTYELTYTLVLNQPGEFRVLPARAWQFYFPEVQGNSAGDVFEIEEAALE